jgi:hypothetical protein
MRYDARGCSLVSYRLSKLSRACCCYRDTVTPSSLVGGGDHDEWSPIFVFWGRLHLISREIERDAVILVGAGRKVERELRSWQPCICPTRRSPQNERDETRLKPKKTAGRNYQNRLLCYICLCIGRRGRRTRSGHGIRSRWWAPPAQRLHPFRGRSPHPEPPQRS